MAQKERIDILLAEKGIYSSRSKAKRAIMAGKIYVNNQLVDKAGTKVEKNSDIRVKGRKIPYVSRGGLKLEKALDVFSIDVKNKEAIDIGASTGGFTDCLLQNGAKKVYAIDVGYGQLAWKLRQDERVEVKERCNFRYLTPDEFPVKVPLIVTDVSFISLKLIIPQALKFLSKNGEFVALVKPQFEAGRERVGKNGLVKDKNVHIDIINEISNFIDGLELYLKDLDFSPVTGSSSKNIEFLIYLQNNNEDNNEEDIAEMISMGKTLVIDPGFYSLDYVTFSEGMLDHSISGSSLLASSRIMERAAELISKEFGSANGKEMRREAIEEAIRLKKDKLVYIGNFVDIKEFVEKACESLHDYAEHAIQLRSIANFTINRSY